MSSIAYPSWCDPTECSTRPDGQLVHRSAGEAFDLNTNQIWTASMLTVQLAGTGEGIEVGVSVQGAVSSYSATVYPRFAVELARSLLAHAERAGEPSMAMTADLAVLLDALEDASITDEERHFASVAVRVRCSHRGARGRTDHPRSAQLGGRPVAARRAERPPPARPEEAVLLGEAAGEAPGEAGKFPRSLPGPASPR